METDEKAKICAKLSLLDDDGPVVKVGASIQEKGKKMVSMSLVGKIFANRVINRDAFRAAIPRIWRTTRDFEIKSVGTNTFIFQFKCEGDRKRVLEGGPWCFYKNLLVLREIQGVGKISDLDFNFMPLWIQFYNL
ncbi:hypothetical protein ACOSQ4_028839 [Xanthoceras sorbifolium]